MAGLDPAIHAFASNKKGVDARHKAGHDSAEIRPANAAISAIIRPVRRHIILDAIVGAISAALIASGALAAADAIPLPRARPAEAKADAAEIVPSPCRVALETIAKIKPLAERKGPGICGGTDMVALEAVNLPDGAPVTISPPAELRCEMASAMARWIRTDAAAAFAPARLTGIVNYDSYSCRARNRITGAKISEHGKGNALDIRAFVLAGNKIVSPVDYKVAHELRESLKASACKSFTTVLGPGSDGYHEEHIHFDLAARRGSFHICHWEVRDKPVEVATIPLPRARPYDMTGKSEAVESEPDIETETDERSEHEKKE
jgi:hypothetical protein